MSSAPQNPNDNELGIAFTEKSSAPLNDPKAVSAAIAEEKVKEQSASNRSGVFDITDAFNREHELGTFVTDRKRKKTSLSESVESAWHEWWGGVKKKTAPVIENIRRPDPEKLRVPKVESRVSIVEKAATHANLAPRDDHSVVIEKIRTFKQDVEKATGASFTVKESTEKVPAWKHTLDTEKPAAPSPAKASHMPTPDFRDAMVAPVIEKRVKKDIDDFTPQNLPVAKEVPRRTSTANQIAYMHIPGTVERKPITFAAKPTPTVLAPTIQKETRPAEQIPSEPARPAEVVGYVAREELKKAAEELVKPSLDIAPPVPPAPRESTVPETFHEEQKHDLDETEAPKKSEARLYAPPASPHFNILGSKILLASLTGALFLGIMFAFMWGSEEDAPIAAPVAPIPQVFEADSKVSLLFSGDRRSFFDAFARAVAEAPSGIVQFYPTFTENDVSRPLRAQEFVTRLGLGLPERTMRALDDSYMLGSITTSRNEPFIMLRSYNFDALFAGMLEWEPFLRRDFAPLFDSSYVETDSYTDAVRRNVPVRILKDALGSEVLLYAIVDQNTVVITSSEAALGLLIEEF